VTRVRFRQHAGLAVVGVVAFLGALPVAATRWYLTPILLVPLAVAIWAWRSGTDADADGLTIRALLGQRRLPWERIVGFVPERRRVTAILDGGRSVPLPAVTPGDLATLLQAGGQKVRRPAAQ
jgi:PH (Pleckstrin Homology) domain-containing protein